VLVGSWASNYHLTLSLALILILIKCRLLDQQLQLRDVEALFEANATKKPSTKQLLPDVECIDEGYNEARGRSLMSIQGFTTALVSLAELKFPGSKNRSSAFQSLVKRFVFRYSGVCHQ